MVFPQEALERATTIISALNHQASFIVMGQTARPQASTNKTVKWIERI